MKSYFFVFFALFIHLLRADECPALLQTPEEVKTFGELRVKAIKGWDRLITWALKPQIRPYILKVPLDKKTYITHAKSLKDFVEHYGYFSIYHPIVGVVTEFNRDIEVTNCLLSEIGNEIQSRSQLQFSTEEILAKVMAYRPLKKGMKVTLSSSKALRQTYIVDEVIDVWHGMPAFGLIPERKNGLAPILLFRGTDLNLTSEKGWASILSDLDTTGPGHLTFLKARERIHKWLKKVQQKHEPARAIGFSLGGVFVLYTMIYEGALLNKTVESIAFNPPGVSEENLKKWQTLPQEKRTPHIIYVNQGDFVSRIGFLLPNVWELTLAKRMGVIQAHTTLICAQPLYTMSAVNVAQENIQRQ